ncbi:glycyl-tRNA synthetase, beta subunit [Candidatus Endolissoclinum faulkneri L2]|uniref:Glycine--tRNA ligase beta subunit n=1 Tax=Candidatus Endolissoclinum faulkneri L2 TaxID=1193729 RepID=K7ZC71_9PROT|nr:glycine--tRNA ligase subunit beta [Candidatus Endolissoclinum faulkneri]AFX98356.1 glycyl-tRNA synthetase, beta subunit [Candidatus Endolissoclinum faulkneri L2]
MAELLLELFSEEMPASMQVQASNDLKLLLINKLSATRLIFSRADSYVTPRRLTLAIDGLPSRQPNIREERRGPRVGASEKAINGFLTFSGVTLDQCERRNTNNGEFWFATIEKSGQITADLLPQIILSSIQEMPWSKSMRWGTNNFRWIRPLHHILAVFDGRVLKGTLDLGKTELTFTDRTRGHRFLAPNVRVVNSFKEYRTELLNSFVIIEREYRKDIILKDARYLCDSNGLILREDSELLEEVCGLVEWPVPLMGRIDPEFMSMPPEVLIASMRRHQKCFAVNKKNGTLADRFVMVSNMSSEITRNATIVAGNEKVLRARLSDAKFFWEKDRAINLLDRRKALREVQFYSKLGTMADKVERFAILAATTAPMVGANADKAYHAALLAKADLTTSMVNEFPDLQGIIGRYYALDAGEDLHIADAIAEHYYPRGPRDICPTSPISLALSIADKVDTLIGFFIINEIPTGSKDPFALRRTALGIIRIIIENGLRIKLLPLFAKARALIAIVDSVAETDKKLLRFLIDRLKGYLRKNRIPQDLITAVFDSGKEDDLVRLLTRVDVLRDFLSTKDGSKLLFGYRRVFNILRAEEKDYIRQCSASHFVLPELIDFSHLVQTEEINLYNALQTISTKIKVYLSNDDFINATAAAYLLIEPINAFFDRVKVNANDALLRNNRLSLLNAIRKVMDNIANFSLIKTSSSP